MDGPAQKVTIYIGESNHQHGKALYMVLLEFLRREGAAGATVTRGLAGYGAHSHIHTANIISLSVDLPIIVEWVDTPERVARLLPQIKEMVTDGLITLQAVEVVLHVPAMGRPSA